MDSELIELIEKDSGMESIVSSKDETPERKTVRTNHGFIVFNKMTNLLLFFFCFTGGAAN